jgi:S-adenosylhomocysteine hydrolase
MLVINDSPIKQFAENKHAVGQSLFESYMRFTNRSTKGKRVTVFGYGACGKGTAACFRNAFSQVSVVDIDPVTTLEANLDGFADAAAPRCHPLRRRADHRHRPSRYASPQPICRCCTHGAIL